MKRLLVYLSVCAVFAVSTAPTSAQQAQLPVGYNIAFIETKPVANADTVIRSNTDYLSLFLDSVFINRDENFLKKNNFAIDVALEIDGKTLSVPVYANRDPKVNGKLGLIHYGLLNSIPASGKPAKVGIRIVRRDLNDPIRRTIDLLTSKDSESLLKTYAANAVPYIGMVGAIANTLYQSFGPPKEGDVLFSVAPITFSPPTGVVVDKFDLRDTTAIIYKGSQQLDPTKLAFDNSGALLVDKKPLTGMPYVVVRLQKATKRQDYTGREWQRRYEQAVAAVSNTLPTTSGARDFGPADRLFQESLVLLSSDFDFTMSDRNAIASANQKSYAKAKEEVNAGNNNGVIAAMKAATVQTEAITAGTTPVTPGVFTAMPGAVPAPATDSNSVLAAKVFLDELQKRAVVQPF